ADPELAYLGVREELLAVPARALAAVQGGLVRGATVLRSRGGVIVGVRGALSLRLDGIEHEHRARLAVAAPAGQMREGAVRAELVEGIVRALLHGAGGDHEPFAHELRAERLPSRRRVSRGLAQVGQRIVALRPT